MLDDHGKMTAQQAYEPDPDGTGDTDLKGEGGDQHGDLLTCIYHILLSKIVMHLTQKAVEVK